MKLNKYLFNTVNKKRSAGVVSGQSFGSSVVSLACISSMCSVQCFPGGHSLRLAFGSFFYRRILAVFCCSFKPFFFSFFVVFGYAWFFVQSLFLRTLGRQSCRDVRLCVWPWFFAWVFRLLFHGLKVRQQLCCGFSPEKDRLWFRVHLPRSQVAHELSDQAVQQA